MECAYDSMGRRAYKKVTVDGTVTLHQRYIYRGYLQIAALDLTRSIHPALWFITWDPTQPVATRPLSIRINGTWYSAPTRLASQGSRSQVCSRLGVWLLKSQPAYGWDLTKTICELYGSNGYIRTAYSYTPYGEVTGSANGVYQPIQWSSELFDDELSLTYYNYRYYNHLSSCWLTRDLVERENPYISFNIFEIDMLGLDTVNVNVLATYYVDAIDVYFSNNSGVFILEELMLQQSFNYNCKENVTIYNYKTEQKVIHEGGRESIGNLFQAVKSTWGNAHEYVKNAFENSIKKYDEARHISANATINDINNNNNGYNIRISGSAKATFTIAADSGFLSWLDGVLRDKFYIYDYFRDFTDFIKATSNLYKAPDIQEIGFHADYKVCCEDGKLKIINMYDTTSASKSIHTVTKVKGSGTALLEAAVSVN